MEGRERTRWTARRTNDLVVIASLDFRETTIERSGATVEIHYTRLPQAFIDREQAGLDTLKQTFGRTPSCYGQPGGAWAPHVYPALRRWGIPTYLDCGPWVNLDNRPHRYGNVLNILNVAGLMHIGIGDGAQEVEKRQARLAELVEQMRHSGGEISLYAHECEFVTGEFWDGVNFRGGRDTPRAQWQAKAAQS